MVMPNDNTPNQNNKDKRKIKSARDEEASQAILCSIANTALKKCNCLVCRIRSMTQAAIGAIHAATVVAFDGDPTLLDELGCLIANKAEEYMAAHPEKYPNHKPLGKTFVPGEAIKDLPEYPK